MITSQPVCRIAVGCRCSHMSMPPHVSAHALLLLLFVPYMIQGGMVQCWYS